MAEDVCDDLRIIKDIRNEFAHTIQTCSFSTEEIVRLCNKFKNRDANLDGYAAYYLKIKASIDKIDARIDQFIFAHGVGALNEPTP